MAKTIGQLINQANEIKTETDAGDNTATRVGEMFEAIIEHLRDVSDVNSSGNGNNSSISLTGLLASLSAMTDPENASTNYPNGAVLKYSGGAWGYDNYGGGTTTTTPGGGLTVAQLWNELDSPSQYASGKKIPATYLDLSGCLSTDTTFWGRPANNGVVTGSLTGDIDFIKFSNGVKIGVDTETSTIKVYRDDLSAAHFYATGGVSALGNSSSGGGNSSQNTSGLPLDSAILVHINGNTASNVGNPSSGNVVYYDGQWKYKTLNLQDLGNVTISNLPSTSSDATHVLTYDNTFGIWKNAPISATGGAEYLKDLQDVVINSNVSPSNYPVVLSKANNNSGTKFENTPLNTLLTNLIIGDNGISVSSHSVSGYNNKTKISLNAANTESLGGIRIGYTQNGKNYPVALSDNKAYVNVPWENTEYNAATTSTLGLVQIGNGIDVTPGGSISTSISKLMGTSDVGDATHPIYWAGSGTNQGWHTIDLNNGWVTLGTEQTIIATKTFTAHQILANNIALKAKDTGDNSLSIIEFGDNNKLSIGWNTTTGTYTYDTDIYGNVIKLFSGNEQNGKKQAVTVLPSGVVELALATTGPKSGNTYTGAGPAAGLKIGDAVLYWDEANQALALAKYNASTPSSPTAANFYATGGVSALGFSNGTSSIDAMTFGVVDITNSLKIKLGNTNNKATIYTNTGTGLIIDNPYGGIFINDLATYINDAAGDTYFGGDENTNGGKIYICLASQGYEYYRLDVDKLHRDGYLTLD